MPVVREFCRQDYEKRLDRINARKNWSFLKEDRLDCEAIGPEDFEMYLMPSKRKDVELYWDRWHYFYELTKLECAVIKILTTGRGKFYPWRIRHDRRDPPFTMREQILFSMVSRNLLDFSWRGQQHQFEVPPSLSWRRLIRVNTDISDEHGLYRFLTRNGWKVPYGVTNRYAKNYKLTLKIAYENEIRPTHCRYCKKNIVVYPNQEWNCTPLFCSIKCYNYHHRGMKYNCIICGKKRAIVMDWLDDDPNQKMNTYKNRDYWSARYFDITNFPPFVVCDPRRTKSDCIKELTDAIKSKKFKIQRAIVKGAKKAGIIKTMPTSKVVIEEISNVIMEHLDGIHRS